MSHVFFGVVNLIMRFAPIGAFGAMAFTIGKYGIGTLASLGWLLASVYLTCLLFVLVVLGAVARYSGFSLWKFLRYIRAELLLVLGTSSSESALPRLIERLEELGCHRSVVGLVVPTGYSFNLDGTCIYLTMAAIFIAQALSVDLSLADQALLLGGAAADLQGRGGRDGFGLHHAGGDARRLAWQGSGGGRRPDTRHRSLHVRGSGDHQYHRQRRGDDVRCALGGHAGRYQDAGCAGRGSGGRMRGNAMTTAYDFSAKTLDGEEQALDAYRGKAMLIVNTASKCGFTPQYTGLEKLWEKYQDQGLVVLGFPCDQFGHQEPGDAEEIKSFCSLNYDVSFPLYEKVEVNGGKAHPLWKWLKKEKPGLLGMEGVKWNFTKFLVDKNGKVVKRYAPTDTPEKIEKDLASVL